MLIPPEEISRVAGGLTWAMRRLVIGLGKPGVHLECLYNEPADIMLRNSASFAKGHSVLRENVGGKVRDRFSSKTLDGVIPNLVEQTDPEQSGFRYLVLTPLGLAVRAHLKDPSS